jgi:DNA-binding IscR family transcriptional regulator
MADLSKFSRGHPVPIKKIAQRQKLSKLYLYQVAGPIRNASLLKSV